MIELFIDKNEKIILFDENYINILNDTIFSDNALHVMFNTSKLSSANVINLYKFLLLHNDFKSIRNDQVILNIVYFIRSYNELDDAFFSNDIIFFNDIEQFIDAKTQLKDEIASICSTIKQYFLSMICSIGKAEDNDFEYLPEFYHKFFLTTDIIAISEMINKANLNHPFKKIKDSSKYISKLFKDYVVCNELLNTYLKEGHI